MNSFDYVKNNIKFLQYDAKITIKLHQEWKGKDDKEIAKLMVEIDEDDVELPEVKCPYKKPRIGNEYQVTL